jgi:hypothetical protein
MSRPSRSAAEGGQKPNILVIMADDIGMWNISILFEMHDFHGWTAGAMWEDMKFDFKHWRDIERLAIVGESKWEKGMAAFCKPFTSAKIQYFDHTQLSEAETWLRE